MICTNCMTEIDDNSKVCPNCGGLIIKTEVEIKNIRLSISNNKILIHNEELIEIEGDLASRVYYENIESIDFDGGYIKIVRKNSDDEVLIAVEQNLASVKEIVIWIKDRLRLDDFKSKISDAQGIFYIQILSGSYSKRVAVYDSILNEIVVNDTVNYSTEQKHYSLVAAKSISEVKEKYNDNSTNGFMIGGLIGGVGVGLLTLIQYNGSDTSGLLISVLMSFVVSGAIWGGVGFVIGKYIKSSIAVIRIITKDDYVFDIENEPIIHSYLFSNSYDNKAKDNSDTKSVYHREQTNNQSKITNNIDDKYNDLLKLKDLLDKGILTEKEFEIEKKKILG